jgi:hypothetical protein
MVMMANMISSWHSCHQSQSFTEGLGPKFRPAVHLHLWTMRWTDRVGASRGGPARKTPATTFLTLGPGADLTYRAHLEAMDSWESWTQDLQ